MIRIVVAFITLSFVALFAQPGSNAILIDFSETGKPEVTNNDLVKFLYNDYWRVTLNSSADFLESRRLTYAKSVPVAAKQGDRPGYTNAGFALGVRINFPSVFANQYAIIKPMNEIQTYPVDANGNLTNTYENKGVIHNVSIIKSITLFAKGKNYPHSLYINLADANDYLSSYFMGYFTFDGWAEKVWNNPLYLEQVRDRRLTRAPYYPRVEPVFKFSSFTVFRNMENIDGDFVAYFGNIKMVFDKAVDDEVQDINDEDVWGVRKAASQKQASEERDRLKNQNELERLELIKMGLPPSPATTKTAAPAAK